MRRTANGVSFRCPGCGDTHTVPTEGSQAWGWNGSLTKPTLTPSILVKSGHYVDHHKKGDPCWCGTSYGYSCYRCHSHVTNGRISFCADSSHALAGKEVDLVDDTDP